VAIIHEPVIQHTASAPRKYLVNFRVHSSHLMLVLLITMRQCFMIPSSYILPVLLATV
jgi:hypothetical protein